ncbi:MAG: amidohydrolase [Oscillospiraceae bacterium]|nr:amidohydrolase [Oscillospiraceae bacterium]
MKEADIILKSNAIFDAVADRPSPGFVAVLGNRILAVGKPGEDAEYQGAQTKVYDLGERLVMPGFHDSHVHLLMSGMYRTCADLHDAKSEDEACRMLKEYCEKNPSTEEWVIGFSWYQIYWDVQELPTVASLDKYFPDRPCFLLNAELHGVWVNSKALEIAGITKDTPDPLGGIIERDKDGNPTGFLYETAIGLAGQHALKFTPAEEKRYLRSFMEGAAPLGITSVNDLMPYFRGNIGTVSVYSEMDKDGELTVRINASPDLLGDLDEVVGWREAYTSEKITVRLLKQFLDGVATTHTALMIDDYSDAPGNRGIPLADLEMVRKAVLEAHKRELSVKLHSCGDYSCRLALDYYEEAIKTHGKNGCRHTIEHLELVDPADVPRFTELGVIPSMQPEHIAAQTYAGSVYPSRFGPERMKMTWPLKTMLDAAGVIAIGTDSPVVSNNPFFEIYRAVTRVHEDKLPAGGDNPQEKLTMTEVLRGYTYGSAYGVRREHDLGTLEAGKLADIAVIDRNLFTISDNEEILDASVCLTVMDGKVIHENL